MENVEDKWREEFEKSFQFAEHQLIWDERVGRYVSDQTQYLWGGYLAARKKAQKDIDHHKSEAGKWYREWYNLEVESAKEIRSIKSQIAEKDEEIGNLKVSNRAMTMTMDQDEKYKQGSAG